MKIFFIDTETTGLSDYYNDIIQIAGIVVQNGVIIDEFNFKCQPINWNKISDEALKVTNTTIDMLKSYELPQYTFIKFMNVLEKHYNGNKFLLAGQNVKSFDWRFLKSFWDKTKRQSDPYIDQFFDLNVILELLDLTRPLKKVNLLKVPNVKLGTIIESLDIKIDGSLHDALTDIKATHECFNKIIYKLNNYRAQRPNHEIFKDNKVMTILNKVNSINN